MHTQGEVTIIIIIIPWLSKGTDPEGWRRERGRSVDVLPARRVQTSAPASADSCTAGSKIVAQAGNLWRGRKASFCGPLQNLTLQKKSN
mmetsp:Transcript_143108/g.247696  ORF Transcript_143108/g.247696 Transcript_143108/m.247696 type:complete len:89 (-) Transcript_143108:13-279(-)